MAVRIVTDSTSDIPLPLAQELNITVIPLFVHFGTEVFRDSVDLSPDEFYRRLKRGGVLPKTSVPPVGAFTETYSKLAGETDAILSIHISAKLSGTYDAAILGKKSVAGKCRIEVIDSWNTSMALGLLAILAARAAREGASLEEISQMVHHNIPRAHLFGMVDTLEYLQKGGRIGSAEALMGTALNIKPILTVKEGETFPLKRVRSRSKAIDELCNLAQEHSPVKEMAILHSTTPDEAEKLAGRLDALFPKEKIPRARFGPVLGTYVGPGSLGIALIEQEPGAGR